MHRCVEDTKNTCVQALGTVYGIVWSAPNAKNDTDILERWRYDDIEIGVILICTCVNVLIAKRFECAHACCLLFNIQVFLLALDTGTLENTVLRCPNHHIGMWNRFRGIPFSIFSSFCCLCRIVFTLALVCPILISVKLAKQQKWCTARMLMTSSVGNLLPIFASCLFIKTFGISHSPILNSGQRIQSKHNSS